MFIFLDILFLIWADFYQKREPDIFEFSAVLTSTVFIMFNVILIDWLTSDIYGLFLFDDLYKVPAIIISICVPLLFRYFKVTNYIEIQERVNLLGDKKRFYYNIVYFYMILSIVLNFGYAIYIGPFKGIK